MLHDEIPTAPDGLSADALTLWTDWHLDLDDDMVPDAREAAVLAEACKHLDLALRLGAEAAALPSLLSTGSRNNSIVHPIVAATEAARKCVAALLKSIAQPADRSTVNKVNGGRKYGR